MVDVVTSANCCPVNSSIAPVSSAFGCYVFALSLTSLVSTLVGIDIARGHGTKLSSIYAKHTKASKGSPSKPAQHETSSGVSCEETST